MIEEWKEVEGYTSYIVSNTGIVKEKSIERVMPQTINGDFWCTNLVSDSGKKALCKVHRLVAIAFVPNPEGSYFVDPIGDRLNTNASNLMWRPKIIKPEKVVKVEESISYLGLEYTMTEFVILCKADRNTVKARLKSGWTSVECVVGVRSFQGVGYEDGFIWYPTKGEYEQARIKKVTLQKLKRKEEAELERLRGVELRKQEKADYRKAGVGNFVNYPIPGIVGRKQLKVYRVWSSMISRCYSLTNQSYDRYGGRGVYVCDEWHEFQNFAAWYYEQYQEDDWHIDKDILSPKDDVRYSHETCVFIPATLNTLLATMQDQMRDLPMGVMRTKTKDVYSCQYSVNGVRQAKQFTDVYKAALHYKIHKEAEIKRLTEEYKERLPEKIYQFFINYTIDIREEFKTPS